MSNEKKNSVSFYIVLDSKANKQGLHKVYVRFLQDRKKREHFLGLRWPADKFDRLNELLLPRFDNDPDVEKNNLYIQDIKTLLNKIHLESYLKNRFITIDEYITSITQYASRTDFLSYMELSLRKLYLKKVLSEETYKKHKSIHKQLKAYFGGSLPMLAIDTF